MDFKKFSLKIHLIIDFIDFLKCLFHLLIDLFIKKYLFHWLFQVFLKKLIWFDCFNWFFEMFIQFIIWFIYSRNIYFIDYFKFSLQN